MLRQPRCSTSKPPSVGPTAVPTLAIAVQSPIARAFCLGSGKAALTSASDVTLAVAAAMPCTPRAKFRISSVGDESARDRRQREHRDAHDVPAAAAVRSASVAADMMKIAMPRL